MSNQKESDQKTGELEDGFLHLLLPSRRIIHQFISYDSHIWTTQQTHSQNIISQKVFFFWLLVPNPNIRTLGKVVGLSVKHTETEGRINDQLRRCTMQTCKTCS